MPRYSLDSLTLTDTRPQDAIRAAASAGFDLVSLWTIAPPMYPSQLLSPMAERECRSLLTDGGIGVHSIEAFDLTSQQAVLAARPAIELGARLGGQVVLALHFANPDRAQAIDTLALLAEQARTCRLGILLEPVAMGQTRTLEAAAALIRDARIDAGILFDTYHFARVGGRIADIDTIGPDLIRYVQVCDGMLDVPRADWITESLQERLYPGRGEFPLAEMLRRLRQDVPWAVETPSLRRMAAGMTPEAQAIEAMAALATAAAQAGVT